MAKQSKKKNPLDSEILANPARTVVLNQELPACFRNEWNLGLILFIAVILTYLPVWWAGYIWDDDVLVTQNPCIVGPLGLQAIWTTNAADICPLVITTFWMEHALWGLAPLPYHLVNVFLQGTCAVLLWRVLRRLQVPGAWLGAALWALHPVAVESVAWITEMKNTESCLFFLLSILFFLKCVRSERTASSRESSWNYLLTLLFAALAMASKSSTVILPVVLLLCAWWIDHHRERDNWQWRNLLRVAPIFLMSIATSALSIWTQGLQLKTGPYAPFARTWPERLVTAGDAVWFYLDKLLWPHPLMTIYPRWKIDASQWLSYLPLLLVIIVLIVFWFNRKSWSRSWFFCFSYFLLALLPVIGLVDLIWFSTSYVADHFQYLASMGPLALAGAGIVSLTNAIIPQKPWLQSSLCAALLLILGILSLQQVCAYENLETLCTNTLAKNPASWGAHNGLGNALMQIGHMDEAMTEYQKASEINPNFAEAHNNLGNALLQTGHVDEAMVQYQKALEINPNSVDAHSDLAWALLQKRQVDEAIAECQKALEINPNFVGAHGNLGIAFALKGKAEDSISEFQKALAINPNDPKIRYNLGNMLLQRGQLEEATTEFQKVLEINPNHAGAHDKLGMIYFKHGQIAEAVAEFQEAVRLNPNDNTAKSNLAKAQALIGNPGTQ